MSFYGGNFLFDGISNEEMGVVLVTMEDGVLMDYGVKYTESIQTDLSKNNQFYYSQNSEVESIVLGLSLVDKYGRPLPWNMKDRVRIIEWMVKEEFCPFVSEDDDSVVYYLKCTEYTRKFNHAGQGIIEFTMQPESKYAYTPVVEHVFKVQEEKEIVIDCLDNVNKKHYPIIEVLQFNKDKKDFTIQNLTTNTEPLVIQNLVLHENVVVDNLLKNIKSDVEVFKLKDINRKWFYLKRGINRIRITGDCEFKMITQYPLKV